MPTCFVSLIHLYDIGFNELDNLSEDIYKSFDEARQIEINDMMEKQFLLSYSGNISKADSDDMTPFELLSWVNLLKKIKSIENSSS